MNRSLSILRPVAAVIMLSLCSGCMMIDLSSLGGTPQLTETVVQEDPGWFVTDKILMVDISGVILRESDGGFLSENKSCTPEYIRGVFDKALRDPDIRGILLRIDSPGGSTVATEIISQEILRFRKRRSIPVYAHITGTGASGAYHIACTSDKIYAQPAGLVGSIGVIMALPQVKKLAEKIGYDQIVIKSGKMKDIGNIFRAMTDEEKKLFQALIDEFYGKFLDHIVAQRDSFKEVKDIKALADGRIYSADQAKANGLIDEVSDLDAAIAGLQEKAGVTGDLVTYSYRPSAQPNIYSSIGSPAGPTLLGNSVPTQGAMLKTGFYYLWAPGL